MIDIGWAVIQRVETQHENDTYTRIGFLLGMLLACMPVIFHMFLNRATIVSAITQLRAAPFSFTPFVKALLVLLQCAFGTSTRYVHIYTLTHLLVMKLKLHVLQYTHVQIFLSHSYNTFTFSFYVRLCFNSFIHSFLL